MIQERNNNRVVPASPPIYSLADINMDTGVITRNTNSAVAAIDDMLLARRIEANRANTMARYASAAGPAATYSPAPYAAATVELPSVPFHLKLPHAGTKECKAGEYEKLSESQKLSLDEIVANGMKGLESPHITWAATQLLEPTDKTALSFDVFNNMVSYIFIGNVLLEKKGVPRVNSLDNAFKLISMYDHKGCCDLAVDANKNTIKKLNEKIDQLIIGINRFDPRNSTSFDPAVESLLVLFSIFMTLRREIYCEQLLWNEAGMFKFDVDHKSKIMVECSKVTYHLKLLPIHSMYNKICTKLVSVCLLGTMDKVGSKSIFSDPPIYEPTDSIILDKLLLFGQRINRIV
jgi:hypothetical protein